MFLLDNVFRVAARGKGTEIARDCSWFGAEKRHEQKLRTVRRSPATVNRLQSRIRSTFSYFTIVAIVEHSIVVFLFYYVVIAVFF